MLAKATHIKPIKGFFLQNRLRLIENLKNRVSVPSNSFILLRGATEDNYIYDDDQPYDFAQDPKFWWATGCLQPDVYSLIDCKDGGCVLYSPKHPESRKHWDRVMELEEYEANYEINEAKYDSELEDDIKELKIATLFILGGGVNKYSGEGPLAPEFGWFKTVNVNNTALYPVFNETALFKTEEEIKLIKEAARIASEAHEFVMQNVYAGVNESHIQTLFRFYCKSHGWSIRVPYEEICASGENAAILHYQANCRTTADGEMILLDAGTKVNGYCSDMTSTFPINGKFSEKQKQIYEIVLAAHEEVKKNAKAGVHYQDLQIMAEKVIVKGLIDLGLIRGEVDTLWEKRASYYFFPHGIGHHIGTYTHDLLGDPSKENEKKHIPKQNLRVHRVLEANMVVTNEPGIYFIERLLNQAKTDPEVAESFNFDLIKEYAAVIPGTRIEDMLLIKEDGAESLTNLPRTVEQIEKCMAKQEWK